MAAKRKKDANKVVEHAGMEVSFSNGEKLCIEHLPGRKLPMLNLYVGGKHVAQATIKDEENAQAFVSFFRSVWGAE